MTNKLNSNKTKRPMSIITERTTSILTSANLPNGAKSFSVPDDHKCFDQEQQTITANYKAAFGCQAATSTFKAALNKKNERVIYSPSVISKDGALVIEWGTQTFPLPAGVTFAAGSCSIISEVDDVEYALKVRVVPLKKEDLKPGASKVQTAWADCKAENKVDYLARAYAKGTLVEIVASSFDTIYKLADVVGTHSVVAYRMNDRFGKYELKLADGRWIGANSALQSKLASYDDLGVEVSEACPAQLTVSPAQEKKTATGYSIYPVSLLSFRNIDLPVFSFGDLTEIDHTDEDVDAIPESYEF